MSDLVERARELRELATLPAPPPLPDQDCRVGEAMAGVQDQRNRAKWQDRVGAAHRDLVALVPALADRIEALESALEFYADPENYHAIGFMFDRPCGLFEEDFGEDHGHEDYNRPMPGKLARTTLNRSHGDDNG